MHGILLNIIPIVVIFALFWFMILLPEKKRKKKYGDMMSSLNVNDEVMTRGGIIGKIIQMDEQHAIIETAGKTRLKILRNAIAEKIQKGTDKEM
ncbi:MAG: preprotein translocase subunit YajC [Clostridium sp.]|uniref:preprotein translocase subunit YajC n=1 Tax=Clostridium sp. TaxID=1506 RepID=UPI003F3DA7DF